MTEVLSAKVDRGTGEPVSLTKGSLPYMDYSAVKVHIRAR